MVIVILIILIILIVLVSIIIKQKIKIGRGFDIISLNDYSEDPINKLESIKGGYNYNFIIKYNNIEIELKNFGNLIENYNRENSITINFVDNNTCMHIKKLIIPKMPLSERIYFALELGRHLNMKTIKINNNAELDLNEPNKYETLIEMLRSKISKYSKYEFDIKKFPKIINSVINNFNNIKTSTINDYYCEINSALKTQYEAYCDNKQYNTNSIKPNYDKVIDIINKYNSETSYENFSNLLQHLYNIEDYKNLEHLYNHVIKDYKTIKISATTYNNANHDKFTAMLKLIDSGFVYTYDNFDAKKLFYLSDYKYTYSLKDYIDKYTHELYLCYRNELFRFVIQNEHSEQNGEILQLYPSINKYITRVDHTKKGTEITDLLSIINKRFGINIKSK